MYIGVQVCACMGCVYAWVCNVYECVCVCVHAYVCVYSVECCIPNGGYSFPAQGLFFQSDALGHYRTPASRCTQDTAWPSVPVTPPPCVPQHKDAPQSSPLCPPYVPHTCCKHSCSSPILHSVQQQYRMQVKVSMLSSAFCVAGGGWGWGGRHRVAQCLARWRFQVSVPDGSPQVPQPPPAPPHTVLRHIGSSCK